MTQKKKPTSKDAKQKAKQRAQAIFRVHTKQMTVRAAAQSLGVSRKTYYEWEAKALAGMMAALEDKQSGRPLKERDLEKEALEKQVRELEAKVEMLKGAAQIRQIVNAHALAQRKEQEKKRPRDE
jgi:transposase